MDQHPNEIRRFISLIDILYERCLETPQLQLGSIRVIFDAEAPIFRFLGVPLPVQLMEEMRKRLKEKFRRMTDAFDAFKPFVGEDGKFSRAGWISGASSVLGFSSECAD
ncbi:hypothetical protein EBH_0048580 [Eimeria brunetti]|uniref:Uncharacterized protein n=1 Tax=Eimeria brunetti TaxID=51314 RepID=U6LQ61_9EIME|nr:hypothetical protein EBH_0048580 [Eimeria brunetti]